MHNWHHHRILQTLSNDQIKKKNFIRASYTKILEEHFRKENCQNTYKILTHFIPSFFSGSLNGQTCYVHKHSQLDSQQEIRSHRNRFITSYNTRIMNFLKCISRFHAISKYVSL